MPARPMTKLKAMLKRFHEESGIVDDVAKSIDSVDGAVLFMAVMYDLLQDVRDMVSVAESRLIELTPQEVRFGPAIPIPGGGSIEFHGGKEVVGYKDNPRLLARFAYEIGRDLMSEYEITRVMSVNGEDLTPNMDVIFKRAIEVFGEAVGVTPGYKSWRAGVAKRYGIDLKSFQEKADAPITVTVRGRGRS